MVKRLPIRTGLKEIDVLLDSLKKKEGDKIGRAALGAGARRAAKAQRASVGSSEKEIRRAIGSRLKRGKKQSFLQAKAGAGVGSAKQRVKKTRKAVESRGDTFGFVVPYKNERQTVHKLNSGIGISVRNIHWFFLGTKQRRHKSGKSTGPMPAQYDSLGAAAMQSADAIFAEMRKAAKKRFYKVFPNT